MRLILHTSAYWLMLTVRDAIPKTHALTKAEFATIRARLLKIGARIRETTHRDRIAFAAACPDAELFPRPPHRSEGGPRLIHRAKPKNAKPLVATPQRSKARTIQQ
jgi:hypothetical protein